MRNPGWAGAALIAVALAVTACGTGSGGSAGGAYGYGNQTTQTTMATTPGAPASPSSVATAALKTETTRAGMVLANSGGLTLYYYTEDKPGSGTVGLYRWLRYGLAAAGRPGQGPGRASTCPVRSE